MAEPPTSAFEFNTLHRNPMHESLNPQHLVDHVATWLEGHPCKSEDYEESNADLAWPPIKKRTRDTKSQDAQEPQRKARCLAQISGNSMRRRSPRKTPTNEQAQPILQDQSPLRNKAIDLDQTPRAQRLQRLHTLDGASDGPPETFEPPILEPSYAGSSPSRDSFASSQASRSHSPRKRLGDTQFSNVPIDIIPLEGNKVPEDISKLFHDLKQISKGIHVIPNAVREKMQDHGEQVDAYELAGEEGRNDIDDSGFTQPASWDAVVDIWEIALDCQRRGSPEPTWNSEVHSRLLRLALRGHWQSKGIWYQDITTARISDKSLVPSAAAVPIQSKLVDYAMIIDSSRVFQSRIIAKLTTRPDFNLSINATAAEWIRFNPIAVSIETKRGAISQDEAFLQLGIWTAAHFAKLRQLMQDPCAALPVLPVLFVQGHEWKLILAIMTSESRLEMHAYLSLGETGSLAGIYRVLATLRRLSKWIDEQYRPWFEDKILSARE